MLYRVDVSDDYGLLKSPFGPAECIPDDPLTNRIMQLVAALPVPCHSILYGLLPFPIGDF